MNVVGHIDEWIESASYTALIYTVQVYSHVAK